MWYMKGARYHLRDKTTDMVTRSHPIENKVSFEQMLFPGNRLELKLYGNKVMKELKITDRRKEL